MKYNQLTQEDRIIIYTLLQQQFSYTRIGKELCKHKSTISREVERNSGKKGYRYKQAQHFAVLRKVNSKKHINLTLRLKILIEKKLKIRWSPEQISQWMKINKLGSISHETIYQMIRVDRELGGSLYKFLRQSNRKRRKVYGSGKTLKGTIKNRVSIDRRPKIVDDQKRIGDFEADTIIGKNHKGAIVTIVDRKSLYLKMFLLPERTSESVSKAINKILNPIKEMVYTITFDNGKEFALHSEISRDLEAKVFFANPYSFWQRAINENTNGLIRQYIPKKTDFSTLTKKDIERIEHEINNRPRKKLGFKTPQEIFWKQAAKVASTT